MKYKYEYEIKYQEVDFNRRLRLYVLENYLLETAGRVADELGFGIKYLYPEGLTWILTRLSVEMTYFPTHGETMVFETWIEQNAHMISTRNFRLYLKQADGELRLIGICKSQWAVLSLDKREIVNVFDRDVFTSNVDGEVLEMARPARIMPIAEPTGVVPHIVQYSDVDYNRHCNSCKYLETMLNAYRPDWAGKNVRLDINYQREVKMGLPLNTHYLIMQDGVEYIQKNEAGENACTAKITINLPTPSKGGA